MEFILSGNNRHGIYGFHNKKFLCLDDECRKRFHYVNYSNTAFRTWEDNKVSQLYLRTYKSLPHRIWVVASLYETEGNFRLRQELLSLSISYVGKIVFVDANSGKILKTGGSKIGKI